MQGLQDWQANQEMQLQVTATDGAVVPLTYGVVPLTGHVGLNGTERSRDVSPVTQWTAPQSPVLVFSA